MILLVGGVVDLALSAEVGVTIPWVHWFGSNPCGGLSGSITKGFRGAEGGVEKYTVTDLVNHNATQSCTLRSVAPMDPGFSVSGGNLPLTIPADAAANLSITIGLIGTAFDANLSMMVG
ncbi:MAG TPA: hypothetical protein VEG66_08545 [Thermoplasmata archaeon]|nr:hypothetical protein [Thermoplasmata archaeon]